MGIEMKRIARMAGDRFVASDVLSRHADLTRILRRHLPASTAALFARPKAVDGGIYEWYSDLGGQPQRLADLPAPKRASVERLLRERLQAIAQLADKLEAEGGDGIEHARLLRDAARYPDPEAIYVLKGEPVLTFWGSGEVTRVIPPANLAAAAATGAATAAGATALAAQAPTPRRKRLWWLLLLLLLGLLAWLLCRYFFCADGTSAPALPLPVTEKAAERAPEPVPPEEAPEPPPPPEADPVDKLAERVAAAKGNCVELQRLVRKEPLFEQDAPDPRVASIRQDVGKELGTRCRKELIKAAKNMCPGERPKELAPELAIVFDASGSMDISMLASETDLQQFQGMMRNPLGALLLAPRLAELERRLKREPKRITVAKQAATAVVRRVPSDVNIGLVLLESCPGARSVGFFPPARHAALRTRIESVSPAQGTPLADGVSRAGALLDGRDKESIMLVISDGEESCGGDPCTIARRLKSAKPNLKINVVDIMGTGAGNCLAQATGGQVFTARNVKELNLMTERAAQDAIGPGNCSK